MVIIILIKNALILTAEKTEKVYIPLLDNEQILNKDFHAKLNSKNKINKVINPKPLTTKGSSQNLKNDKRNSKVSMINEQESMADE